MTAEKIKLTIDWVVDGENEIKGMKKIFQLFKAIFGREEESVICHPWSEYDSKKHHEFAKEHQIKCGIQTPWVCFRYTPELEKKLECPVCGESIILPD